MPLAAFTGDGAYDQDSIYRIVADRGPGVAVIVPPRNYSGAERNG
jgi:hypothetical protein